MENKRLRKLKNIRFFKLLTVYIAIWFIFGLCYWGIANFDGRLFVFQEDLLLRSKAKKFEQQTKDNINYEVVEKLFKNYEGERYIGIGNPNIDSNRALIYWYGLNGYKPIGIDWANYYSIKWIVCDYNFFFLKDTGESDTLGANKFHIFELILCEIPEDTIERITPSQYVVLPQEYFSKISKKVTCYLAYEESFIKDLDCSVFYPLESDTYLISQSYIFPDDAFKIVYEYEINDMFQYPLSDFLYFSAVTISTLGFGDILPNSSLVRILVTIETLIGMIMIAIIASSFYEFITNKSDNI